ncbi:MAG: insulinase family protein [Chloroflexi bacterium]|nr:insulinase family protein [Chloroflexota bacterium]
MYQKSVLSNGLRVVTATVKHLQSAAIGVFIGAGSRYEDAGQSGVSHFIEHMCFKGTQRRPTSREISEAIEGVGGILNGATDKELTIYWCKVARPHLSLATDVLADMLTHSKFEPGDVEKERQVITEEINMCHDSPQNRVDLLIDETMWPDQALGRDVAGTKTTVANLTREDMLRYCRAQYLANNTVVSVAGDVDHREVVAGLEDTFGRWNTDAGQHWYPAHVRQEPRYRVERRDTEQAHLCLAMPGLPVSHGDRFILDVLNTVLGEGMSSRLFLEIRENKGLAYAINSYANHFQDAGQVTVYAGIDPKQLSACVEAIMVELGRLKEGLPEEELKKAKEFCKGRLVLRMEDTRSVVGWLGGQELLLGHILTVDEVVSKIDSVRVDDVVRVARELLLPEKVKLAVVGPVSEEDVQHLICA